MKHTKLSKITTGLLTMFGCVANMSALYSVSVDLDLAMPGIQSVRNVAPGECFTAGLELMVDAGGVSSYGISVNFDTTELSLNGAPAAANNPALPGGLMPFFPPLENNALGQVYSFTGFTLGIGPVSTTFSIGTINFCAVAPLDDGIADVTVGFFNAGFDGLFDNGGGAPLLTFNDASVVPEPASLVMLLAGALGLFAFKFRRSH